jgi:2-hydroxychromene-2-carboxylate isomerase
LNAGDRGRGGAANVRRLEFWFDLASTYSYLSAARIGDLAEARGTEVSWEPFLLGPIFKEQGWDDSPFNVYPAKGRYMWRDLERRCDRYGLPFVRPSRFPRNGLLAARVATLGREADEPWTAGFVEAVFRANFVEDREISDPTEVGAILDSLGLDHATLLKRAVAPQNKERLRARTKRAREIGIFGAPSFLVGAELFWGDDRLGDALAWAAT